MLTQLVVENIALVDRLELEFAGGMSVVTGETGAGKSIMLDALGLALGDRAESALITDGEDKAEIHARFDLSGNPQALAWLEEREIDVGDGDCLLRRIVSRDGRSRGFINGTPATVADLKMLGDMLIDIHSQHEHQSLLKRETHRRLLDEFGGLAQDAQAVDRIFDRYHTTRTTLDKLITDAAEQSARLQLLSYQSSELEALAVQPGEIAKLEAEQQLLANASGVLQACNDVVNMCSDDESADALARVSRAIQALESLEMDRLRPIIEMLETSRIQLEEAVHDIARFADGVELDPGRLAEVEARLNDLYEIARKHRIRPAEIPELQQRIDEELATLGNVGDEIERLQQNLEASRNDYFEAARRLSKQRRAAAKDLESRVTGQLARLGMQGASFAISLTGRESEEPAAHGMEDIEFLVSTNPGQPPRALNRVASGGELSRISLAIQVVTADTSRVPTLVFDEVDVGIGGAVAEVVGSLLRKLGKRAQIVCVTHLPQVAAQGNHHFVVTKASEHKRATTRVKQLSDKEKVVEIARMLGGVEMTDQSIAHAQEMYESAQGA